MKLSKIDIAMVGTTHPGNIGAAARAMKTMAIANLSLVSPKCEVDEVAEARASGAESVLAARKQFDSVADAVADCQLVVGATGRRRSLVWPEITPAELAERVAQFDDDARVAVIFGPEHSGLTNDDVKYCHYILRIPTNPDFSSLNLAAAIQIVTYELHRVLSEVESDAPPGEPAASHGEIQRLLDHFEETLIRHEYIDPRNPGLLMHRMSRLCLRAEMSRDEVNIMRGVLKLLD
jgi:tRNA (cytidine32/uridine32-2'-O)-methyltransferase